MAGFPPYGWTRCPTWRSPPARSRAPIERIEVLEIREKRETIEEELDR
jgi:hypothetical protein